MVGTLIKTNFITNKVKITFFFNIMTDFFFLNINILKLKISFARYYTQTLLCRGISFIAAFAYHMNFLVQPRLMIVFVQQILLFIPPILPMVRQRTFCSYLPKLLISIDSR